MSTQTPAKNKKFTSLSYSLVLWFLLLALTPLVTVSWISFQQANQTVHQATIEKIQQSAALSQQFVQTWFDYRFMDLKDHAESIDNHLLLKSLSEGYQASQLSLGNYVKSNDWNQRSVQFQNDLLALAKSYDYIYDLFLIDAQSNILFTLAKESDLGTNLANGPYAKTRFAHSVQRSLQSGNALFSDLERYAPSNNIIAGFLTTPLLDVQGEIRGVFAIQIRFDRILKIMHQRFNESNDLLNQYLVGADGLLRTTIGEGESEILNRRVDSEQFRLWQVEHENSPAILPMKKESPIVYVGPDGSEVIGLHHAIVIGDTQWALISEIDHYKALAPTHWLKKVMILLLLCTGFVVVFIAVLLARRIARPIVQLANISQRVSQGETNIHFDISARNEIGQLAKAFEEMLQKRQQHDTELELTSSQAQLAYLQLAEQKFALDQHAIVAITDVQGTINFVNDKFCEISGYKRQELIGQNHRLLNSGVHDVSYFREMYRTIAQGEVWHGEICNKAKDGRLYWVDTTIVPFTGANGKPQSYIAIRADITDRKHIEADLIQAKDAAELGARQKSEFLANMSHEIRTPMNGIIGMTGLLLDTDLTAKQRSYAETSLQSAEALLTIINDILDFSKIEAGKLTLEEIPFDLQAMAEDITELLKIKCQEKSIELLLQYTTDTPRFVMGDPGRIRQIILNLLSNAIKFTEQGYILLRIQQDLTTADKPLFQVAVQDTGVGIPYDKQQMVFNAFDQADSSTTRKYGGTGLGLSISKQLCELMGGSIMLESEPGKGSTFFFTMNLTLDTAKRPVVNEHDTTLLKGKRALIVDDIAIARTIISEQIAGLQLTTEFASSGTEALDTLRAAARQQQPFDIVITDFRMPEMDGQTLAQLIRKDETLKNMILVIVTSSPKQGDESRLKTIGFDGYLTKPTRTNEISRLLTIIATARQHDDDIPLVTRHNIRETKNNVRQRIGFRSTHILIAEDNPVNLMVATEYLEKMGCSITPAGNGLEALQLIKQRRFDLVFMDCQMPEMDGFEATRKIRDYENKTNSSRTPIIAFTANAMQGDRERCLDSGMDDYITKPVSETALETVLSSWLSHKQVAQHTVPASDSTEVINQSTETNNAVLDMNVFTPLKKLFGDKFPAVIEQRTSATDKNLDLAKTAIETQDFQSLERAMHSIKSSSRQFGALALGDLAEKIEMAAREKNLDTAIKLFAELIDNNQQVSQQIQSACG